MLYFFIFGLTAALSPHLKPLSLTILHRHGDRSPLHPLTSSDEFWQDNSQSKYWSGVGVKESVWERLVKEVVFEDCDNDGDPHWANGSPPYGKLTQLGFMQLVKLGGETRERVDHFFSQSSPPSSVKPTDVKFLSTPFDRTKMSAVGFSLGFFPESTENTKTDKKTKIKLTPDFIPDRDGEPGPTDDIQFPLAVGKEELDRLKMTLSNVIVGDILGGTSSMPLNTMRLLDHLTVLKSRSLISRDVKEALPNSFHDDCAKLELVAVRGWRDWVVKGKGSKMCSQVGWGFVMGLDREHNTKDKVTVVSCHDSTLVSLMSLFGQLAYFNFDRTTTEIKTWPGYASWLQVEFYQHQENDQVYVRFLYDGTVVVPTNRGEECDDYGCFELNYLKEISIVG